MATDDDGGESRNARLTALLTERGKYVLRLHARGDGGAGTYRIRSVPDPVRALPADGNGVGTLGAGGVDVWSFPAEILLYRSW